MNEELKEYTCTITLVIGGNNHEATSINEYKEKVKDSFYVETGIKPDDSEITDIKESQ